MTLKGSSLNKHTAVPVMHSTGTSMLPSSPRTITVSAGVQWGSSGLSRNPVTGQGILSVNRPSEIKLQNLRV